MAADLTDDEWNMIERMGISTSEDIAAEDRLLTVGECAQQLSMSHDFVAREIRAGALAAVRRKRPSGRSILRIPESAWREYLKTTWQRT
jgi:excisionase family DNA binding protein